MHEKGRSSVDKFLTELCKYSFTSSGLLILLPKLLFVLNDGGREPHLWNIIQNIFNMGFQSDAYEPVSFKLSKMITITKLYSLIAV